MLLFEVHIGELIIRIVCFGAFFCNIFWVPGIVEQCREYSVPSIDKNKILSEHMNIHEMNIKIEPSEYIWFLHHDITLR